MLQGVPPLAARSGFNTPIAESNEKYNGKTAIYIGYGSYTPEDDVVPLEVHHYLGIIVGEDGDLGVGFRKASDILAAIGIATKKVQEKAQQQILEATGMK
ncbi:MAG: hypothetical protein NTX14_01260 [Candidatus Nealsonbacteria bacterium]|nr:hypothetical protein [Candidatus Nealsonbacteria bacterium]